MHRTDDKNRTVISVIIACAVLGTVGVFAWMDSFKESGWTINLRFLERDQQAFVGHEREQVNIVLPNKNGTEKVSLAGSGVPYIEIIDSCDHDYQGDCVVARAEPHYGAATTTQLRAGMVLEVAEVVERNGQQWFKITFGDQWLRYPERVTTDWYVEVSSRVELLYDVGELNNWEHSASTTNKTIIIDKSEQKLYAYEGEELFLEAIVSTGLELSPTTEGTFEIFKKTPTRYMQGPIEGVPGSDYYDLSGVPWNLYFTAAGEVIHGTYWHESFGQRYSHGCVNLWPETAKRLYQWTDLGTTVTVRQ